MIQDNGTVKRAVRSDSGALAALAVRMWTDASVKELEESFASDCELNNDVSFRFHIAAGFEEINRIICFKKRI